MGFQDISGGLAIDTLVQDGGTQNISNGGTASGTTVANNGFQVVTDGLSVDGLIKAGGTQTVLTDGSSATRSSAAAAPSRSSPAAR